MADDILNSPACRENKLGLLDILHFAIGQNKEYVYKSCFYWSLIDYCITRFSCTREEEPFDPRSTRSITVSINVFIFRIDIPRLSSPD